MTEAPTTTISAAPQRFEIGAGVVLRRFEAADIAATVATINAELDHLRPFMPWAAAPVTVESQTEWLQGVQERAAQGLEATYGIFRGDDLLGACGLMVRRDAGTLEIGYWLRAGAQGQGLVTRAADALTRAAAAMPGVRRVAICCDVANTRSAAVPRRLGYTHVGNEPREVAAPGETGTHMVWTIDVEKVTA